MKIYLSSPFLDLKDHRQKVGTALRKAKYEVVMMEEYVARDELVETACRGDVSECHAYIGIFAWRYGHIPEDNNPRHQSVAEMEYGAAEEKSIPRLMFLAKEGAEWPEEWRDADQTRILELRNRVKKRCNAYFENASELAIEVLAALRVLESTRWVKPLKAIQTIHEAQKAGPSYMHNILDKLEALRNAPYIEIQIGPTPWWNTRLHLIAALAEEFGTTAEFVFVDADRHFVAMAPPADVRRQLAKRWPLLETAYAAFRVEAPTLASLNWMLWRYPEFVKECFGDVEEKRIESITKRDLEYDLGLPRHGEVVRVGNKGQTALTEEILERRSPFAVLERDGVLDGLVDRGDLAGKVARHALEQYR